jgi:glucose 1-dehydrogenase
MRRARTTGTRPLTGRHALVTGGNSGLGEAVARALAAAGASVVVNWLADPAAARQVVAGIRAAGGEALAVRADISDEAQVRRLFATSRHAFGDVDLLVANAAVLVPRCDFVDLPVTRWRRVIEVNLTGHFLCAREAIRGLLRARRRGGLIFMSSVHDCIPWAGFEDYAAAKGGLKLLMESLAQEYAGRGIRVNAISPGAIRSKMHPKVWEDPQAHADLLELIPAGRGGEPTDVASAAVWLASDASDYVHGHTLYVDGGMRLYPAFADGG